MARPARNHHTAGTANIMAGYATHRAVNPFPADCSKLGTVVASANGRR
jgi:hypothetical protein